MYVSVRRYKVSPGATAEIARQVNESAVALIRKVPGFVAYYFVDSGNDTGATISVFQDEAGAAESNRVAARWVKDTIPSLILGPPDITAGNVTVYETA